jgi:hypothetical protein
MRQVPSMRRNQFDAANAMAPMTSMQSTRPSPPATIAVAS